MATEKFANNAQTTLNGTINNSTTSVVVTSATGFPSSGNFRIRVGDEIMLVTAVSGTTFTVTRGSESTSAVSHISGVTVTHIITKGGWDARDSDNVSTGAVASRTSAERAGRLYLPTDGPVLFRDSGSAWVPYGPICVLESPPSSGWSWVNQQSASITSDSFGEYLEQTASSGTGQINARTRTPALSAPYTVEIGFIPQATPTTNCDAGFIFRRAGAGTDQNKIQAYFFGQQATTNLRAACDKYTSATTFSANLSNLLPAEIMARSPIIWWKMVNDGTNLVWSYSNTGKYSWTQLHTVAISNHFSSNSPDEIGFAVRCPNTAGARSAIHVVSWKEY